MPHGELRPSRIEQFVRSRGGTVSDFAPISGGEESQVFSYLCDGEPRVIRVGRSECAYRRDAYAAEHFASPGLPIPAVLDIGRVDHEHAYCISVRAQGIPLHEAKAAQVRVLLEPLTELWRAVGATDISQTSGYGHFDEHGRGKNSSWHGFLRGVLSDAQPECGETAGRIDQGLLTEMVRGFESLLAACPEERRLVHGDFTSRNVLVDAMAVTGLIDWNYALYGDPLYDIATAHFWHPWSGGMRLADDHWRSELSVMPAFRERTRCYILHLGLVELYSNTADGEETMLAWLQKRCTELLAK
jgi:hygromycin-B 4-O-kinase